jgi:acetoin utilization protein AcuB
MTAREIMTPNPITVTVGATVADAAALLRDLEIRHLPVVDNGALVGMLSDRDLKGVDLLGLLDVEDTDAIRAQLATPVIHLMSPEVVYVDPETDLGEVVAAMIETKVGAIPVIEPATREVVGIVSYIDLLRVLLDALDEE